MTTNASIVTSGAASRTAAHVAATIRPAGERCIVEPTTRPKSGRCPATHTVMRYDPVDA